MHVDLEDRRESPRKKVAWLPYAVLITLSAIILMGFAYVYSTGRGITVDLKRLSDAFVITGNKVEGTGNPPIPAATVPVANTQPPTIAQQQSGMRPLNWNVQLEKFNEIFIRHPACNPANMKWPQMECSNFRARAMKRFQMEWSKNSYWNGNQIVKNKTADARVNAEISL